MEDKNLMTRRQVVAGLGTTIAAAAVSPALGANVGHSRPVNGPMGLVDPNPPLNSSRSPGRACKVKWTRFLIAVRTAIRAQVV
jgi:hypothetical protein